MKYEGVLRKKDYHSIWDKYVDIDKVMEMTPEERKKMFPNDFDADGNPYGDF